MNVGAVIKSIQLTGRALGLIAMAATQEKSAASPARERFEVDARKDEQRPRRQLETGAAGAGQTRSIIHLSASESMLVANLTPSG